MRRITKTTKTLEVTKMKERISFSEFLKELYKKTICY